MSACPREPLGDSDQSNVPYLPGVWRQRRRWWRCLLSGWQIVWQPCWHHSYSHSIYGWDPRLIVSYWLYWVFSPHLHCWSEGKENKKWHDHVIMSVEVDFSFHVLLHSLSHGGGVLACLFILVKHQYGVQVSSVSKLNSIPHLYWCHNKKLD